ncbi:MAG: SdiA-regulated domain-containing protein [Flavobacteriales bacterium]
MNTKLLIYVAAIIIVASANAQEKVKLKPVEKMVVHVKEPSDICLSPDQKHFFIVSDDGMLVKTNLDFRPVQTAAKELYDPEAVYADDKFVYVVEERTRNLLLFDIHTLDVARIITYPYNGGRNKGYEAFTFNAAKDKFIMLTEKEPIWIFELDKQLHLENQLEFKYKGDISAAAFHQNKLWLLSDENMEILQLNPHTYQIEKIYSIPVINPEGLTFMPDGRLVVVSDDMQKAYFFNLSPSF